jgi:hypothetical protein
MKITKINIPKILIFSMGLILIICGIKILDILVQPTKEEFSPKWLRTKKNRMMRMLRRSYTPYTKDAMKKLQSLRRKWL